jgi:small subunit ribosomal protein S20
MPNIKSAKKRLKQSIVRRERNKKAKSTMRTYVKQAEETLESKDANAAAAVKKACAVLDKTAGKGFVHKNFANRKKSRLAKKLNSI